MPVRSGSTELAWNAIYVSDEIGSCLRGEDPSSVFVKSLSDTRSAEILIIDASN